MKKAPVILRSLDPYHQRIGYLGALSTVANRGLDTADALRARLTRLLFTQVSPDDELRTFLMTRIGPNRRSILERLHSQRSSKDLASVFRNKAEQPWYYLSELWLCDDAMASPIGLVSPNKVSRIIDLAKWCGLLRPTHELSEIGFLLFLLIDEARKGSQSPQAFNLLNTRFCSNVLLAYFWIILAAEDLWPFFVVELVERNQDGQVLSTQGTENLLAGAVDRMLATLGEPTNPADVLPMKAVLDFRRALSKSESTAENYLRPRLETLVDLGFLERSSDEHDQKRPFPYRVTTITNSLASELRVLCHADLPIHDFLRRKFFSAMSHVLGLPMRSAINLEERLLLFSEAFSKVGRDIGFTPGSTVAHLACLLGWERGIVVELEEMLDTVYDAKKGRWGDFLQMSGGSRFDREFLIRVRPGLTDQLTNPC